MQGGGTGVYFNKHEVGKAQSASTLLCKQSGYAAYVRIAQILGLNDPSSIKHVEMHGDRPGHRDHATNPYYWAIRACVLWLNSQYGPKPSGVAAQPQQLQC